MYLQKMYEEEKERQARWSIRNQLCKNEYQDALRAEAAQDRAKMGRPPIERSERITNEILSRLETGETLNSICKDEYMPGVGLVIKWCRTDTDFAKLYGAARSHGAHALAHQVIDIANQCPDSTFDELGNKKIDPGFVAWQRIRMDAMKWAAAKFLPKAYGERQAIEGVPGGDPIRTEGEVDITFENMMAVMENLEMSKRAQGRELIKEDE